MKVLIIGGMAAGPKTAARLRRLRPDARITIVEQGKVISFGSCGMPLYLGSMVPRFESLNATSYGAARDVEFFRSRKDINVLTGTRVVAINRAHKRVEAYRLEEHEHFELEYDYLVLATGAEAAPVIPGLEMPGVFAIRRPDDTLRLQEYLKIGDIKHATIIGAGLIGLEIADALKGRRLSVSVCETQQQVLPGILDPDLARLVAARIKLQKVDLRLGCRVESINPNAAGRVASVTTDQGEIETDLVIAAAGVIPRVELARAAGLEIGTSGAVRVDRHMRTSDPNIFAVGDCAVQYHAVSGREVYMPLASTANKQGRIAADNIAGLDTEFQGVMGTTAVQVFDLNIGKTGLGEDDAVLQGHKVITGIVSGHDAPHYYPLHASVTIKLIADIDSGRLLGAQVCGPGDGIKRLDVLSTAIKLGASLQDISELDLGYAPQYSEPIDVALHAANTLQNKRTKLAHGFSPAEVEMLKEAETPICFLDIRESDEVKARPLQEKGVLVIPAGELRERYDEIPRDRPVIVVCGLGIRSYDAVCFLKSVGFKEAAFLEGGLSTYV